MYAGLVGTGLNRAPTLAARLRKLATTKRLFKKVPKTDMPIRWAYLKRVLAGAIFGLYITNLLYFLNPQIDITPGRLATVTIVYGLICGLLFGSVLWLLRALRVRLFGKPETYGGFRPHGFGFVVLAAFLAAAIYWMHLEVFRIYLPVGAIRVLSKATNLITATAFVLLLIWFAERNADRKTSRILFVASVVLYTHANRPISMEILAQLRALAFGTAAAYSVLLILLVLLMTLAARSFEERLA